MQFCWIAARLQGWLQFAGALFWYQAGEAACALKDDVNVMRCACVNLWNSTFEE